MRLVEAIIDANHRALAGDANAGLHPADYADELPIIALTCIDPRLNALLPQVLGVPAEQFIWLRNAGNIITSPLSSTMRSLALACAVKGGKEIVIIGHTDCQVAKTTTMQLLDRLQELGVERHSLPTNLNEYFGIFASEQANVIKAAGFVRHSPLIGPGTPVHGLMLNIETGKLEWLVNGYQQLETMGARWNEAIQAAGQTADALKSMIGFNIGEMKFPEGKIGEAAVMAEDWLAQKAGQLTTKPPIGSSEPTPVVPPKIPLPRPVRPKLSFKKGQN